MPLASDAKATVPVYLDNDAEKLEADRAVFLYRYVTYSERQRRKAAGAAAMIEDTTEDQSFAKLLESIGVGLIGWRNVRTPPAQDSPTGEPIEYAGDVTRLKDALTECELWELAAKARDMIALSEMKKKVSGSPSSLLTKSSAPSAAADASESANITTASPNSSCAPAPETVTETGAPTAPTVMAPAA